MSSELSTNISDASVKPQESSEVKLPLALNLSNEELEANVQANDVLDKLLDIRTDNVHHPYHWSIWKKYAIVIIYSLLQVFVTLTTTSYVSVEWWVQEEFNVDAQVSTLGQSMFIIGTAIGPLFLGPLSDISGRKWVYVGSMVFYAIFNIGCALPQNMAMLAIFMFLSGISGSTALANVAGTVSDLFVDSDTAPQAMGLFVVSAYTGPSIGSAVGEWIGDNPNMGFSWIFYLNIIIAGFFAIVMCFVPETLPRVVITNATKKELELNNEVQEIAHYKIDVLSELRFVVVMAFKIMFTEPIVIFLGLYNGFAYGLLFLYLDGVFDVFVYNNGMSYIGADLTYLTFVVGVSIMFCFIPVQTWVYRRYTQKKGGEAKPEYRFLTSLVLVWLFPVSLFWFAFTSDGSVNWWSCVVAGAVLGFADPLLWLAMLNYITDSYPNTAGSAIAAFSIPSFTIAAALAHAGVAMFENLSTTWAVAILGFISLGIVVLVYVLFFFGEQIRQKSKIARKS